MRAEAISPSCFSKKLVKSCRSVKCVMCVCVMCNVCLCNVLYLIFEACGQRILLFSTLSLPFRGVVTFFVN